MRSLFIILILGFIPAPSFSSPLLNYKISRIFEKKEFRPMDQTYTSRLHGFGFDQMLYLSPEKFVLLKFSIPEQAKLNLDQLETHEKGFYIFKKNEFGKIYAIFYYGFSKAEAEQYSHESKNNAFFSLAILPVAFAESEEKCEPSQLEKYANYYATSMMPHVFAQRAVNCLVTAAPQAWESTKGLASDLVDFVSSPVQTTWNKIVQKAEAFAQFVKEMDSRASEMWNALKGIEPELAQHMLCTALGDMAPDIVALIVGGASAVRLSARLTLLIQKLSSMAAKTKGISNIFRTHPQLAKTLGGGLVSCAAR